MASYPNEDRSKKPLESIEGYPRLAHHFASSPEGASYRSFATMANLVLLYKQANLVELEEKLGKQMVADSQAKDKSRSLFATDWPFMRQEVRKHTEINSAPEGRSNGLEECQKQSKLLDDSFSALKEYYEFFFLMVQMTATAHPRNPDRKYLQWWLQDPEHGGHSLMGDDSNIWGSFVKPGAAADDLVCVKPRRDDDPLTEWVKSKFIFWFDKNIRRRFNGSPSRDEDFAYKEATIRGYTHIFAVALVSILINGSMGVLFWVRSTEIRLFLIAIFCVLFVVCMTCVTKATRSEIFSAVSAFAAVELVFIANNNFNSYNNATNPAELQDSGLARESRFHPAT
ncbi:MAG: hypothetical protein M1822_001302 [Bathelium mastoideum]|nr:MAG: hypothetical protein M1822_001302 [Bathelium mastoideum]